MDAPDSGSIEMAATGPRTDLELTDGAPRAVSVIIPTRNRHALLGDTLRSLMAQDYARQLYEILVVDDGSEPPVCVPDRVRLIRHDVARGPNAARNTGLKETTGSLVVFIDDDVEMRETWLSALVAASLRHIGVGCFGGPIALKIDSRMGVCGDCPTGETALDLGTEERETSHDMYSCNMMVSRSAIAAVGDFDEDQPIYFDEIEWQHRHRRSGGQTVYVPDALVWHKRTGRDMRLSCRARRQFRFGYGQARFFALTGQRLDVVSRLVGVPGLLWHSARRRCAWGILATSGELGAAWWTVRHRPLSRRERTSLDSSDARRAS